MKNGNTNHILGDNAIAIENAELMPGTVNRGKCLTSSSRPARSRRAPGKRKYICSKGNGDSKSDLLKPVEIVSEIPETAPSSPVPKSPPIAERDITDTLFLDTVRDKVFEKLVAGEIKLDVGDGFKAIEIKHKISDESQNEKLLLEILSELRSEELGKSREG